MACNYQSLVGQALAQLSVLDYCFPAKHGLYGLIIDRLWVYMYILDTECWMLDYLVLVLVLGTGTGTWYWALGAGYQHWVQVLVLALHVESDY